MYKIAVAAFFAATALAVAVWHFSREESPEPAAMTSKAPPVQAMPKPAVTAPAAPTPAPTPPPVVNANAETIPDRQAMMPLELDDSPAPAREPIPEAKARRSAQSIVSIYSAAVNSGAVIPSDSIADIISNLTSGVAGTGEFSGTLFKVEVSHEEAAAALTFMELNEKGLRYVGN